MEGATVKQGDVIAYGDSTGWSTGTHCHFEVYVDDERIDPISAFPPGYVEGDCEWGHVSSTGQFSGLATAGSSGSNKRQYGPNEFQGTVKLRRVAPDKSLGSADGSVAQGTTTAIGGEEITQNDDLTFREQYIKTWQANTTVYLNAETPLYSYKNSDPNKPDVRNPYRIKENGQTVRIPKNAEAKYTGNYKVQETYFTGRTVKIYVEIDYQGKVGYVDSTTIDIKRSVNLIPQKPSEASPNKDEKENENNNPEHEEGEDNKGNNTEKKEENKNFFEKLKDSVVNLFKTSKEDESTEIKETEKIADLESTDEEYYRAKLEHALAASDGILMIGDSITNAMNNYKSGGDVNCTYKANDGWTARRWLNSFNELQKIEGVKSINILLGANDAPDNPDGSLADLKELVEKLHGEYPDVTIYVDKCLPQVGTGEDWLNKYNSGISSLGLDYVKVIDVSENIQYEGDGVHPTVEGSKTLFENIQKQIQSGQGETPENSMGNGTIPDFEKRHFKVALAAGGAEGNEDEVIKASKIVDKVKELLEKDYKNISIELTGNSYNEKTKKTKIISEEERKGNAKDYAADVAVEVRLNPSAGIDAIYRENDGYGLELAGLLVEEVSQDLNAQAGEAGSDVEKLGSATPALNNYVGTRISSAIVRTEGGLVGDDAGIEKCATGIRDAIVAYLKSDHANAKASVLRQETQTDSIKSKVVSLKYVPNDEFEKKVKSSRGNNISSEPFNLFTLDTAGNIKTTSWSYSGSLQIKENSPINIKTTFAKYCTPFEYMLIFYVQMNERGFTNDLADEIINNSEFVITLQDNTTSVQVNDGRGSDTVTTALDVTYARTWFAELYKESSFSSVALQLADNEEVSLNVKGLATYTETEDDEGNITKSLDCKYDLGEGTARDRIDIFAKLFQDNDLNARLQPSWIIDFVQSEEAAARMTDLTKYLIYAVSNMYLGVDFIDFEQIYKLQHFDNVSYMVAGGGLIEGSTLQETVWFTLLGMGFSEYQAAGIMGNISQECDWDNTATGGGLGFFQYIGDRASRLEQYAASKGKDWTDVGIQLEYMHGEMTPGGGADGYAVYNMSDAYVTEWDNADSPEAAASAFCSGFERAGLPMMEHRTSEARRFYEEFHGRRPPTNSFSGSGNYFIPERGYIYYQNNGEFSGVNFYRSGGPFSSYGCGPTSVAMCVSDILGQQITPVDAWSWTNYAYAADGGMSWAYPGAAAEHYGLQYKEINSAEELDQCLREGKKVISSHGKRKGSPFPVNAHIIYYAGMDAGGVIVKDPNYYNAYLVDNVRYDVNTLWNWSSMNWAIWK